MTPIERLALTVYRADNPTSRAETTFRYSTNSGQVRERECICCGSKTGTWSGNWPRTKRTIEAEESHDCLLVYLASRISNPGALARAYAPW
jgi:hypothetical protein